MALDVKVKIELSKPIGSAGFGIPLLLASGATAAVAYTECSSLNAVKAAGFAEDSAMYAAAEAVFSQENKPAKIAVCAVSGTLVEEITALVSRDWRQLVIVDGDTDNYIAVADYIETTNNKMLFASMTKSEWNTFKSGLSSKAYDRTVFFINSAPTAAAALVGETAGRAAGSFTYKFKTLKGISAEVFTDEEITALHEAGAFAYVTKAGDDVTTEGISQSGKYIDITDSIDYVIQNIEYKVQKTFNTTAIVNYDNRGIALIEAAVKTALQEAAVNGIIAQLDDGSYDYSVSFPARSATTEADRASRVYNYGTFTFSLAGAIHNATITGEVVA